MALSRLVSFGRFAEMDLPELVLTQRAINRASGIHRRVTLHSVALVGEEGTGNLSKRESAAVASQKQRQGGQSLGRTQRMKDLVESRFPDGTCLFWWKPRSCARG